MKKITSILLLAFTVIMLSSCIIVAHEEPTYTITFYNDLVDSARNDVFDWYAKTTSGTRYVVSSYATHVRSGGYSSQLSGLYENKYCVIFTFDDTTDAYDGDIYYSSEFILVDRDTDFILQETNRGYTVSSRSATNQEETSEQIEKGYQIVDTEGNVYPLTKVEK